LSGYGGKDGFAAHLAGRLGDQAAAPPALAARAQAVFGTVGFAALLAPSSPAAIAEALALCSAEGWPVVPLGALTWPVGLPTAASGATGSAAAASSRPPVLLSTVRLDRITEHEPADLVIGVQAGLPLRRLDQALRASRQWLPLDPPAAIDATIGAVAALGAAGPLRARHGTPRDMALGVEIATGDGRLVRFGGRVVKNVAGYDGVRLAIGSRGTLGIITAIFLRVRGTPRADRTLALPCGSSIDGSRRGADLALAIRDRIECDALELIAPAVATTLSGLPADAGWTLLVRVLGSTAAVDDSVDRLHALAGVTGAGTRPMTEVPAAVWTALGELEANARTAIQLTGQTTTLPVGIQAAAEAHPGPDASGRGWLIAAHAADGVIRMWQPGGPRPDAGHSVADVERLEAPRAMFGWTMRYDTIRAAGPADAAGSDPVRTLTRRLRDAFDPAGILAGRTETQ
jgi:glycolate oxidase FAD binding subunit